MKYDVEGLRAAMAKGYPTGDPHCHLHVDRHSAAHVADAIAAGHSAVCANYGRDWSCPGPGAPAGTPAGNEERSWEIERQVIALMKERDALGLRPVPHPEVTLLGRVWGLVDRALDVAIDVEFRAEHAVYDAMARFGHESYHWPWEPVSLRLRYAQDRMAWDIHAAQWKTAPPWVRW